MREPAVPEAAGSAHDRILLGYVAAVVITGLTMAAIVLGRQADAVPWTSTDLYSRYVLTGLLIAGELRPLMIARHDGGTDQITVSSPFSVALVLLGPLSLPLVAQAAAGAVDDLRHGRSVRAAFNVGQMLVTLTVTRLAFCLASGEPVLALHPLHEDDLPAALIAGVAYFLVNNVMVAVAVALDGGERVSDVLREDFRVQTLISSILLGLAPVAAVIASFSSFMLPLLVLPVLAVQHSTWVAARRQHEAMHDGLTGLPNRALFLRRAAAAVAAAEGTDLRVGVMLLDLDHFKEVNDTLGHHVGDGLLREVAARVVATVGEDVTVARLGGDEFALLIPAATSLTEVVVIAERLAGRLREPVLADGVRVGVQASIGIAVCPDHAATVDTMLQRADIAMYRAKDNRGEIQIYRTEIDQHTVLRLSLLGDLTSAIDNNEFVLLYQPQLDAASGTVVAVEALMRWRHPTHGIISPDVFIPLAESTGTIAAMSRSAMDAALHTLAGLRSAGHDVSMAVNVSARMLSDLELPVWIGQMLLTAGVPASRLTIEVTESTITADPRRAMQVLQDLREIGVRLAVDDFGTGYSSLSYLRRLQPDELKIDKSFVMQMQVDENSEVIVRSTIELAHGLGLSVVAEGVEDAATLTALAALGADRLQGFHIARPMSAAALAAWLNAAALAHTTGRIPADGSRPGSDLGSRPGSDPGGRPDGRPDGMSPPAPGTPTQPGATTRPA